MKPSSWGVVIALVLAAAVAAQVHAAPTSDGRCETLVFDGNIIHGGFGTPYDEDNNFTGACDLCPDQAGKTVVTNALSLATNDFVCNLPTDNTSDGPDPLLGDPQNVAAPNFMPAANSPVFCENGATVIDAYALNDSINTTGDDDDFFSKVDFIGAVGDTDWYSGWIYTNQNGGEGRTDIDLGKPNVVITSDITSDTIWTSDNNYTLVGRIGVGNGVCGDGEVTLTIEPGTAILGSAATSYLVIERDATLIADGTESEPIIMTSAQPFGQQAPGDWGGLVIHGRAVANCAAFEGCALTGPCDVGPSCESEGGAGDFGGDDDNDSSGIIRYVRIEYSGREISPNNELNCFTMNSVGRNTTIEYVQATWGTDDGHEWFGGTARCKYLVASSISDDNFDWQMGWRGEVQFAIAQQNFDFPGDRGIEADNNEFEFCCPSRSNPVLSNLTLVGAEGGDRGIEVRRGTAFRIVNSLVLFWDNDGIRLSQKESACNGAGTPPVKKCDGGPVIAVEDLGVPTVPGFFMTAAPNPVFATSTFQFSLDSAESVTIGVYDSTGRFVTEAFNGRLDAGQHAVDWTPGNIPAGVYYYEAEVGSQTTSGKLLLLD